MSPKKNKEKFIVDKFLEKWNKQNNSDFVMDEEHLKKREDNENPDVIIFSKKAPEQRISVEVTHAADSQDVEVRDRTWLKMIAKLEQILKTNKDRLYVCMNEKTVIKPHLVKIDLRKFEADLEKFASKNFEANKLAKMGYRVIYSIKPIKGKSSSTFGLGKPESQNTPYIYLNSGYFERIETALEREKKDLIKKNKKADNTILLIEIDFSLTDEIQHASILESEIENYCWFIDNYTGLFKDIFIIESGYFYKVFSLKELDIKMFNYFT